MRHFIRIFFAFFAILTVCGCTSQKKIAVISGNSVHYWGDHENAIMGELVSDMLREALGNRAVVEWINLENGGNIEEAIGADAVILFAEGEKNHPLKNRVDFLKKLKTDKTALGVFHYALMFDETDTAEIEALDALIGGHYQTHWSVNPYYEAKFEKFANHECSSGVRAFNIYDEWHFNMKFQEKQGRKIIPLSTTIPPDKVRKRRFGANTGNPFVRKNLGREETIFWLCENPDGSRGFGCTGGHSVWTLAHPDFRKLIINASVWLAGLEVKEGGFEVSCPSMDDIAKKIKKPLRPDYEYYYKDWKALEKTWLTTQK